MTNPILLTKLSKYDNKSFELFQFYLNATSSSMENAVEEFNICINNIKYLTEKQYDFAWLSENAKKFEVNRRDFKNLCDDVCILLGNRIEELCKHSRETIVSKPTRYEDYCPFSQSDLVEYGSKHSIGDTFTFDGTRYVVFDTKLESTPYYNIYCSALET